MIHDRIEQYLTQVDGAIVGVRHFKSGRIDEYGQVLGIKEYSSGQVPFEHQDHFHDCENRVIKLEKYDREFSKPTRRLYFYDQGDPRVKESIWFDRYGNLDNIHRYAYDGPGGRMSYRAEYNREGMVAYGIHSGYDLDSRLVEERWTSQAGSQIKRLCYSYDQAGELVVEEQYSSNNLLEGYFHLAYDQQGNLVKKAWHNAQGRMMSTFLYECDEFMRVTQVSLLDENNQLLNRQVFKYDPIGNVIEETWYDSEGAQIRHRNYPT